MKFLDQLEQKAKAQKEAEERLAQEEDEQQVFYKEVVDPLIRDLFEYLKKLCAHLNYLEERASHEFEVPGYGLVKGVLDTDTRAVISVSPQSLTVKLVGAADIPRQPPVEMLGEAEVRRMRNFLRQYSLRGNESPRKSAKGLHLSSMFRVEGKISVGLEISASVKEPDLHMLFTNFDGLGRQRKVVPAEAMDEDMMDRLARFIAGVDASFLKENVDESVRQGIRDKLQQQKRAMEQSEAEAAKEAERLEREEAEKRATAQKLSGRFQMRLEQVKRKIEGK